MFKKIHSYIKFITWKNVHLAKPEFIQLWQQEQIEKIVNHAYVNSAFYRRLWDEKNINPKIIHTLSDIEKFPIINKKNFSNLSIEEYFCTNGYMQYHWRKTSGSTGEPFSFISNRDWRTPYSNFLNYRFLFWENFSLNQVRRLPIMVLDINNIGRRFNNTKYFSANDIVSKPEEILQEMYDFNPVLIDSFPSFLLDYTKAILTYPHLRNPNLRYIITKGENLTITQRKYFEEKLQCEVIDRYGMEEFGPVGTECKERYGFHISMESFLVEIIDEQGKPVPLGETGRIIITDFRNYAMPFIRYDTKDRGHYIKEKCICGRPGHKLLIEGRETEFLYLKDKKINYFEFWEIMRDHSETVLQYQIVHTSDFAVTLLLVPSSKLNTFTHNLIQKKIESLLGPLYKVTIEVVSSIKKTKRGKVKLILNLNP